MLEGSAARLSGWLWTMTFVLLGAVQAVFFGNVFQRMDSFLVGASIFGISSGFALTWTLFADRAQFKAAFRARREVVGANICAAVAWLVNLLALQMIEPAVAFTVFSGAVPLTAIGASLFGVPEASPVRNGIERMGYVVIGLSLVYLSWITLGGQSGFVRGGALVAAGGLVFAALSGGLLTWMFFYCQRMTAHGVRPITQFGLRFVLYVVCAAGAAGLGIDAKGPVEPQAIAFAVAVGLAVISFPIYALQRALALMSALSIGGITALGPLVVFLLQSWEGRVEYAPATLVGLWIYFAGAMIVSLGASRVSSPVPAGTVCATASARRSGVDRRGV